MSNVSIDQGRMEAANLPPPIPGQYTRLKGVSTSAAVSAKDQVKNIIENLKLKLPMLYGLTEFNKVKGFDHPIALVGGGPSLKTQLDEVRKFKTIISCGSVHDYLITNKIIPTYAVNCDPDPICARYFTKPDSEVKYLISTSASKGLLEALKGKQILLWHCHSDEQYEEVKKHEMEAGGTEYQGIGGGCTVGLRSLSIAMCLGYGNIHFFGFDSCMGDEEGEIHHAYDWSDPSEADLIDKVYQIRLGGEEGPEGKMFTVAGYQLAQIENFKDFFMKHSEYFVPTFHGEGALTELMKLIRRDFQKLKEKV